MELPSIKWVKNDPEVHQLFEDGTVFIVALQVRHKKGPPQWDFDVVETDCVGEGMTLKYRGGEPYDSWDWTDFEYFALLDGEMPRPMGSDEN